MWKLHKFDFEKNFYTIFCEDKLHIRLPRVFSLISISENEKTWKRLGAVQILSYSSGCRVGGRTGPVWQPVRGELDRRERYVTAANTFPSQA